MVKKNITEHLRNFYKLINVVLLMMYHSASLMHIEILANLFNMSKKITCEQFRIGL